MKLFEVLEKIGFPTMEAGRAKERRKNRARKRQVLQLQLLIYMTEPISMLQAQLYQLEKLPLTMESRGPTTTTRSTAERKQDWNSYVDRKEVERDMLSHLGTLKLKDLTL
ncbi:uncharacterized protein LOC112493905 [Cephus cinctus]|uniref:Uncharacterized protein LOC112493905 n=1 Tax=Cephus cinctus TaxID=211228 RepID=A0AAJ7RB19_CEPCN|nr:uncharacterized protein LOC112493905 [Cephus cinctus]